MFLNFSNLMFLTFDLMFLQVQFDLVTAAFTLSELPGVKDREDAVLTLWRKTNSYMVCVRAGVRVCGDVHWFVISLSV